MGNLCCNFQGVVNQLCNPKDKAEDPKTIELEIGTSLFGLLGYDKIAGMFSEVSASLQESSISNEGDFLVDLQFDQYTALVRSWGLLTPQPDTANKLHHYYTERELPFTPGLFILFTVNTTPDVMKAIDANIDSYETLSCETSANMILTVHRFRTKKLLFVAAKEFFVVRVIKRTAGGEFWEFTQSVQFTNLKANESFGRIISELENQAFVNSSGMHIYEQNGKTLIKGLARVDILSSVGMRVLKPILKKKMGAVHTNLLDELVTFIKAGDNNARELVWFEGRGDEISGIISENQNILRALSNRDR